MELDNVTIDGLNTDDNSLSIINSSTGTFSSTIAFTNGACNNTITKCTILGSTSSNQTNALGRGIIWFGESASANGNNNNTISNNSISHAGSDSNRPNNVIYSFGTSGKDNSGNIIHNNNIYNFFRHGATSQGIDLRSNTSEWTISDNSFYETTSFIPSSSVEYRVINIVYSSGNNFTISGNYIGGSEPECKGTPWSKTNVQNNAFSALYLTVGTTTDSKVQGNTISNFDWANSSNANWHGLNINSGILNIGTVTGNTIGTDTCTGSITFTSGASGANFYGILLQTTSAVNCQNNKIGSITVSTSNSLHANHFWGICKPLNIPGTTTIINNVIGSKTTANSIEATSASTNNAQTVYGINNQGTGIVTISGNTIANMTNGTTNTATSTTGLINGIMVTNTMSISTNTITNNTIRDLSIANANNGQFETASAIGILFNCTLSSAHNISGNVVYNISNTFTNHTGTIIGIYYNGSTIASTISRNFIHSLTIPSSSGASIYGIRINAGRSTYSNNIISLGDNTQSTFFGIYETGSSTSNNNDLYFNTIFIGGTPSDGSQSSYAIWSNSANNVRNFRNNIFMNARSNSGTASGAHYAIYTNYTSNVNLTINCNNYYVTGTGGVLGRRSTVNYTTLSTWQAATIQDVNSKSINPVLSNPGDTSAIDYLPSNVELSGVSCGVTVDYGNNSREHYSMGAWDYEVNNLINVTATNSTIGKYTTMKDVFDNINNGFHQGDITVSIYMNTTETIAATLNASGSGSANYTSITISPAGGETRTIEGNIAGALINLNGATNVTIDGLNSAGNTLTISNTNTTSTASTIQFIGGASNNTITKSTIIGSTSGSTTASSDMGIIFFSTGGNNNNTISYCNITHAGTIRPRNAIYSYGSSGTGINTNNTISNNSIYNFFRESTASFGVHINLFSSDWTISQNSFYETSSFVPISSAEYRVIQINNSSGNNFTISGNYIGGSQAECGGTAWTKTNNNNNIFYGIYLLCGNISASNIQGNSISNIHWSNSSGSHWYGMWIQTGTVNIGTSTGNTIGAETGNENIFISNGWTGGLSYGIYLSTGATVICENNKIGSITATTNNSANAVSIFGIFKTSTGATTIANNTIGSTTTANSIHASSESTGNVQTIRGIHSDGTGITNISGNTIANMTNATTNTTTSTRGLIHGISVTAGTNTINNNTIDNLKISNLNNANTFEASILGISLNQTLAGIEHEIIGNKIANLSNTNPSFAGNIYGIYKNGGTALTRIEQNHIQGLEVHSSTTNASIYGISNIAGTTDLINNLVVLRCSSQTTIYGIFETGVAGTTNRLLNNTIYLEGSPTVGFKNSFTLYSAVSTNLRDFRNNIFFNNISNSGATGKHYAIWINHGVNNGLPLDYNNYFAPGNGGMLGRFNNLDVSTLPISSNSDAFSLQENPEFLNTIGNTTADFSPQTRMNANPDLGINIDINNLSRTSYQMGAIEPCKTELNIGTIGSNQAYCIPTIPTDIEISGQTFSSIQWQISTDSVNFSDIPGENTYILAGSSIGSLSVSTYFRAAIYNPGCIEWYTPVVVVDIGIGISNIDMYGQDVCQHCPVKTISVFATGENITYQWYVNTTNSNLGGTSISGANSPTYTPSSSIIGTFYFYCEVSNTCGSLVSDVSGAFRVGEKPTITSIPLTGHIGDIITINGSGFSSIDSENWVYISSQKATIVSSSPTQLEVIVPPGSVIQPILYTNASNGLSTESSHKLIPTLNNPITICTALMNRNYRSGTPILTSDAYVNIKVADLNGNGFLDVAFSPNFFESPQQNRIRLHRNISSAGGSVSFDNNQDLLTDIIFRGIDLADINSDGKPDIIGIGQASSSSGRELHIFMNETPTGAGTFSFSAPYKLKLNDYITSANINNIKLVDIDGDGKLDIVTFITEVTNSSLYIFRNLSTPDYIKFSEPYQFGPYISTDPYVFDTGDLDGDGKPDIVFSRRNSSGSVPVNVLINNSTPGNISFDAPFIVANLSTIMIRIADMDVDGKTDITVLSGFSSGYANIIRNIHTSGQMTSASFTTASSVTGTSNTYGYDISDMNGDGYVDFALTNYSNASNWMIRQNLGTVSGIDNFTSTDFFQPGWAETNSRQFYLTIADFNNDGKPDMAGKGSQTNSGITFITNNCLEESSKMIFITTPQTSFSGAGSLNPAPVIQLVDGDNNPLAISGVSVTIAVHTGSSILSGTLTRSTDVNGRVTFSGLSFSCATNNNIVLRFTSPCLRDTLFSDTLAPNSVSLTDTIQIGASQPTPFDNLITALSTYELADIQGHIVFELIDATYDLGTNSAIIRSNSLADTSKTLTIKPADGVTTTITSSNANGTLVVYGTDYLTISGSADGSGDTRDLFIVNSNSSASVIRIENLSGSCGLESRNVSVEYCNIIGNSPISSAAIGIFLVGASHKFVSLKNNVIEKCGYGINASNTSTANDTIIISNNIIGSDNVSNYVGICGIHLGRLTNSVVENNTIFNIISTTSLSNGPHGIFVSNASASAIQINNNHIYEVIYSGTLGYGGKGIRTFGTNHIIYNNIINNIGGDGSTTNNRGVHGIYVESTNTKVYHNTVYLAGDYNGYSTVVNISAALYMASTGSDVRNNIFLNSIEPSAKSNPKSYAVYSIQNFTTIDYNNYFVSGANGVIGFRTSDRTDLTAWQTATGQDVNSINTNPGFINAGGTVATHYTPTAIITGILLAGYENDYSEILREDPPTIGALEGLKEKMWTGTIDTDWHNADNWNDNLVPTNTCDIIIPVTANQPIISNITPARSCKTEIQTGATLTMNSGASLSISGDFENNGTLLLKSDSTNGTATILTNGIISGSGDYEVEQYITTGRNWYISSPISDATSSTFNPEDPNNVMYFYNETTNIWSEISNNSTNLISMRGYISNVDSSNAYIFTGKSIHNGALSLSDLTYTTTNPKKGYHLIGNPYPSYLNPTTALKDNATGLEATIWYRTYDGSAYKFETFNYQSEVGTGGLTENIPPMQSFWLRVTGSTNSIEFTNSMRNHKQAGDPNLKANPNNNLLRLYLTNTNNKTDEAIILFNPDAGSGYNNWDSEKQISNNIPQIWSMESGKNMVINSLPEVTNGLMIPLFMNISTAGNHVMSFDLQHFDAFTTVWLQDLVSGSMHDIRSGDYLFANNVTSNSNRFILIFDNVTTEIDNSTEKTPPVSIYSTEDGIYIFSIDGGHCEVFDVTGKIITQQQLDEGQNNMYLGRGVYIVRVTSNVVATVKKVVVL
jgi:hypothetical protein